MVEAAKSLTDDDDTRWEYLAEAEKLLKQLAARGHAESQYYLGNLYASGLLSRKNKNEFEKAFPLFVQATKHHHADAAYRLVSGNRGRGAMLLSDTRANSHPLGLELRNVTKMVSVVTKTAPRQCSFTGTDMRSCLPIGRDTPLCEQKGSNVEPPWVHVPYRPG